MTSPVWIARCTPLSIAPSKLTLTVETESEKMRPFESVPKIRTVSATFFRCSRPVAMNFSVTS
jgi:hypothetical protein